jgi:putative FmdB family regulatory protein
MPEYEYECRACGHKFTIYQGILEDKLKTCPRADCGADQLHRVPGGGGVLEVKGNTKGNHAKRVAPNKTTRRT